MIKNKMKTIILGVALTATSLFAGSADYKLNAMSLVGIEGGGSSIDYTYGSANGPQTTTVANLGLKIGAETEDFRVFLSTRYLYDTSNSYDYILTYGGELQYKFNAFEIANFFIGVNGGMANIRFSPSDGTEYRTLTSPYIGGDIGTNIHLGKTTDLELGGRFINIDDTNTINSIDYNIRTIASVYASIIFKWQMN